ncbi:UDP-N-acetylglucosamine 1-carboxyvinyltransferase [bacterium]|nr:UDP-N-acetylglucosamine 1-carboxyvinyltransferase [bacterium]
MKKFIVEGGHRLKGTFIPAGNKNEALPVIAATLLTDEPVILKNMPEVSDAMKMLEIATAIGADVTRLGPNEWKVQAKNIKVHEPDYHLASEIRGSFLFAGSMLGRHGRVSLPSPGGDKIGRRRLDTHIIALQALGAAMDLGRKFYKMEAVQLNGKDIFLDEASVMATENAVMAAVLANGETILNNAAGEPHVQGLCRMLNAMGADISGIGSNILRIRGVKKLHGCEHTITNDHIEIGSIIGLAAATKSEILIKNTNPKDMRMILLVMNRLGINVEIRGNDLFVSGEQSLEIASDMDGAVPKIDDAPWPGFPADLTSIIVVSATQCKGMVLVFEKMFESRLFFVDKLITMGARIVLCDPHRAIIHGPTPLHGELITSPDIRAGMALLIASLCAEGTSTIQNVQQLDRGYQNIDVRLNALGARIEREE